MQKVRFWHHSQESSVENFFLVYICLHLKVEASLLGAELLLSVFTYLRKNGRRQLQQRGKSKSATRGDVKKPVNSPSCLS